MMHQTLANIYTEYEGAEKMIIKKISEKCVKVLIESDDINRYKIPYHKLSSSDEDSLDFIYRLLFLIFDETGVSFLENAVDIQAFPAYGNNYYITVTRTDEQQEGLSLSKDSVENGDFLIFAAERLEDLLGINKLISRNPRLMPENSILYKYAGQYYIVLTFSLSQVENPAFKAFLLQLQEFAQLCKALPESEGILCERGKIIRSALFPL